MPHKLQGDGFTVGYFSQEVTAWGGLALFKRMLEILEFRAAFERFGILESLSNRSYPVLQLNESPRRRSGVSTTLSDRSIAPKGGTLHLQRFKATQSS